MTCSCCGDTGTWVQYFPGRKPVDYPIHRCRKCRCVCGDPLDTAVHHDADIDGGQLCEACCHSCMEENK